MVASNDNRQSTLVRVVFGSVGWNGLSQKDFEHSGGGFRLPTPLFRNPQNNLSPCPAARRKRERFPNL